MPDPLITHFPNKQQDCIIQHVVIMMILLLEMEVINFDFIIMQNMGMIICFIRRLMCIKTKQKLIYIKFYSDRESHLYLHNKRMHWFYHPLIAAMQCGNDVIIDQVLQCKKFDETGSDCVDFTAFEIYQDGAQTIKLTFESILNNINSNMYNRYNIDSNNCTFNSNYSII